MDRSRDDTSFLTSYVLGQYKSMVEWSVIRILLDGNAFDKMPLEDGRHGVTVDDLSQQLRMDRSFLQRLLGVLVASGLISCDSADMYRNTQLSAQYRSGGRSSHFFRLMFDHCLKYSCRFLDWLHAEDAIRAPDGTSCHVNNPATFAEGQQGQTIFEILSKDPVRLCGFQEGLAAMDLLHPFIGFYDFGAACGDVQLDPQRMALVDVGGGTGQFLAEMLRTHDKILPHLVVLQDVPRVIDLARNNQTLPDGVHFLSHNFFEPQIVKGARVYHIRACLHDWNDDQCVQILAGIAMAMAPDSKLVIAENVLPRRPTVGDMGPFMDHLIMLYGGRERSESEFGSILDSAGLQLQKTVWSSHRPWAVIEAVKK